MRIALMESSLGTPDRPTVFSAAAEAGADGVELVIAEPAGIAELAPPAGLENLAAQAAQHGLAIPSVAYLANNRTDALIRRSEATEPAMQHVRDALAATGRLGAGVLLLPFFGRATIEQESEFQVALECLNELAETAAEAGVVIGVESLMPKHQKQLLLDYTGGGTDVRHYYDVGNTVLRRQDPATELRELGREGICGVQFKDLRLRESQPADYAVRLGEGQVDLRGVARALEAIGYNDWVTLETPPLDDAIATAKANIAFTRKLLGM